MKTCNITRRAAIASAAIPVISLATSSSATPAILGGEPVRKQKFPEWPVFGRTEQSALESVLASGHWGRGNGAQVERFEAAYAKLTGAQYCVATANGTSALIAALNALDVGPGDSVILPSYTFVATLNVILLQHALPEFVDTDRETFQIDARKLESRLTPSTRVAVPVHLGGAAADLDSILDITSKRGIKVIEDACQAHLGEWRSRKLGTIADCGCFSFQASKNLNSGEGGALVTNDESLFDRAFAFHGNGRARRGASHSLAGYASNGANLRLTEFQGALLLAQMARLEQQSKQRESNAAYLISLLNEIPGISPQRLYPGCTRNAWHLFMMRYDPAAFAGLPRSGFLKALAAEGIPASGGYSPLNKEPFLDRVLASRHYRRIYGDAELKRWRERNTCPENDLLCSEAVWLTQTMLLGPRSDMDDIAGAIEKIHRSAEAIKGRT